MKVLITGGAGFIGSNLASTLIANGDEVTIIDNFSGGYATNIPIEAHIAAIDISTFSIEDIFQHEKFDVVYHLAAYAAEGLSHHIRMFNYHNNVTGSMNIINLAIKHKVKRFIFASSIAVYGDAMMMETSEPKPIDPYGNAKLTVERDIQIAHDYFGLEFCILRLHNVYGPRQNVWDKYRNVMGIFIKKAEAGEPLTIFGDGHQTRCFTYIEDILPKMIDAATGYDYKNRIMNLGSDKMYSINDVVETFKLFYPNLEVKHLRERHEVNQACVYHDKLHITEETPLVHGIEKMIKWYRELTNLVGNDHFINLQTSRVMNIELSEGLPEGW